MVDMYGWQIPSIDGFDLTTNMMMVNMMRECIRYAPTLTEKCKTWFDKTIELDFLTTENNFKRYLYECS